MAKTRRERSFEDVRGAAERMLQALARRTGGDGDEFELGELVGMREVLEDAIVHAIYLQLERGKSWTSIGDSLGMRRQSAYEKYARRVDELRARATA